MNCHFEKVEKRMQSEKIANLSKALIKAQNEFDIISKSVKAYKYNYAPLDIVYKATRKALLDNQLCVIQTVNINSNNEEILITTLSHSSGEYISSHLNIDNKINKINERNKESKTNPIQEWGGILTYVRRYSYCTILGIIGEDEDDDADYSNSSHYTSNGKNRHAEENINPSAKLVSLVQQKGCDVIEFTKYYGIKSTDLTSVNNAIKNISEMVEKFNHRHEAIVNEESKQVSAVFN
jgi:ERF superfamily